MLDNHQLNRIGKSLLGDRFIGVYPLNHIPILRKGYYGFIVNTDSDNLRGKHWIAVYVTPHVTHVFDSFGRIYPPYLINKLSGRKLRFNRQVYQQRWTTNCGWWCLQWLETINMRYSSIQ